MTDPKDPTKVVATVQVRLHLLHCSAGVESRHLLSGCTVSNGLVYAQAEVSYEYMRGTTDEGGYLSPSRVVINKRRIRTLAVGHRASHHIRHNDAGNNMTSRLEPECDVTSAPGGCSQTCSAEPWSCQ